MTELGNRLKEARVAKGISLDDLQTITKIQKRYLVGIEQGNFAIMPGKFYVRAFIKQYAEAVDLNPEEIFDLYKEEVPSVVNTELPELSRVKSKKSIPTDTSKVFDIFPKILIGVFILGASALIYYFFILFNEDDKTKEQVDTGNETVNYESQNLDNKKEDKQDNNATEEVSDEDSSEDATSEDEEKEEIETPKQEVSVVSTSGSDTVFELKNTDRFDLKLVSTGDTWVNMKNGKGTSLFQGMLKKTESQTVDYSKESEAVLVIGNSVNTEIYINDLKINYAVAPTDEVRQDIVIRFIPKAE